MYFSVDSLNNRVICDKADKILNQLKKYGYAISVFTLVDASERDMVHRDLIDNNFLPLWLSDDSFQCCIYDRLKTSKCPHCLKRFKNEACLVRHRSRSHPMKK